MAPNLPQLILGEASLKTLWALPLSPKKSPQRSTPLGGL